MGEIQHLLHKLGVKVTTEQASRILQRWGGGVFVVVVCAVLVRTTFGDVSACCLVF